MPVTLHLLGFTVRIGSILHLENEHHNPANVDDIVPEGRIYIAENEAELISPFRVVILPKQPIVRKGFRKYVHGIVVRTQYDNLGNHTGEYQVLVRKGKKIVREERLIPLRLFVRPASNSHFWLLHRN